MEGAEALLDLMKTPMAEPVIKVAADLVARNLDIPGAAELADRLAPLTPQGLEKAIKSLPKEAQSIVSSMQQQLTQAQQTIQQLQLELKYKMGVAHMQAEVKAHDTLVRADTTKHDTQVKATTELTKAHIDSITKRDVAEIQVGGKLLDTHVKGAHTAAQGERDAIHAAEQAEKAPKGE
jgi:hypothetical protein